jgi:hypothetical protein
MVEQRSLSEVTPQWLAHMMLNMVSFTTGDSLLDPCAGQGGILQAAAERGAQSVEFMELNKNRAQNLWEKNYFGQQMDMNGGSSLRDFTVLAMNPDFRDYRWAEMIYYASNIFRSQAGARALVTTLPREWVSQIAQPEERAVRYRDALLHWLEMARFWKVHNVQPSNAFVWSGAVVPVSLLAVFK